MIKSGAINKQLTYGQIKAMNAAKKRKKKKTEGDPINEIKEKKASTSVVHEYPMSDYVYRHTQDDIIWDSQNQLDIANELNKRAESNVFQMLVAGVGKGKTALAVATLGEYQKQLGKQLIFIITSTAASVAGGGWQETIAWYNINHPDNQLIPYGIESIDRFANVLSNTREKNRLWRLLKKEHGIIVMDECHKYKTPTSKRAKTLQKLKGIRKLGLTATPMTNDEVLDTASYLILDEKYTSKTNFINENNLGMFKDYFGKIDVYKRNEKGQRVVDTDLWKTYPQVQKQMAHVIYKPNIDMSSADMPEVTKILLQLEPSETLQSNLQSLKEAFESRSFDLRADFDNAVVETIYTDEQRIKKAVDLAIAEGVHQPLLFYTYNSVRDALAKEFASRGVDVMFQSGSNHLTTEEKLQDKPVLAQYVAAGESIEFKLSNTSIFYENQWSYLAFIQAGGRNTRRGMKHKVTHYCLVSDTDIDRYRFETLSNKIDVNEEIMENIISQTLDL